MRYRVRHRSTYAYDDLVDLSYHSLHLLPRKLPHQSVAGAAISVAPAPSALTEVTDYFGNRVGFLTLEEPHGDLAIEMSAEIDVRFPLPPDAAATPPWESVRDMLAAGAGPALVEAGEFAFGSPLAAPSAAIAAYAAGSFAPGRPLLEAVLDLTRRINRDFTFDPTATVVSTPLSEVMEHRRGVCQDFAHLEVAALRAMGLAARYVSGYIRTYRPEGGTSLAGSDASHAWAGVFCPGVGWIDVDPTNDLVVREEHIVLGWGRDYGDVSPIRGVILGGGEHSLTVAVTVEPA